MTEKCENICDNDDLVKLIDKALVFEARNKVKYSTLLTIIKDQETKKLLQQICKDEERHYNLLKRIYFKLSEVHANTPQYEEIYQGSLEELIKNRMSEELDGVALYKRIHSTLTDNSSKNMINQIVENEERHAAQILSIISKSEMHYNRVIPQRVPANITTKEVKDKKENIDVDLKIPVIWGLSNTTVQNQINNSIEQDIMEFKIQLESAADEYSKFAKQQNKKFIPFIASTNYIVTYNKNNILSISIIYHEYINGRNVYIKTSYNFDTNTGKSLSIGDLFKSGAPYSKLISDEIVKQLQMNKQSYLAGAAQEFKGIAEDQPFYLEDGNIAVYFGFHQLAPNASDIPIIKVPMAKFKNEISTTYFK